jgi:energy-coupling factor transporter ATP-binding protein EcfA2/metal-responsive CopG/Arc/MetJ family transcriptional regulator
MMSNKEFKYYLPDEDGMPVEKSTSINSLIIIGANGSGKSKLGAWMEAQDRAGIHRVGAQRSLHWDEHLKLKSFEKLSNFIFHGAEHIGENQVNNNFYGGKDGKTSTERTDIDALFAAIFAKRTSQLEDFDERSKNTPNQTLRRENNIVDDIQRIWSSIFPHRSILFKDMKVIAKFDNAEYSGVEMSDGERVGLYLIAQCLCIPDSKTIIIDEPEIHLHRSIMNRLWSEIEKEREDCLFIYITHDTQFAANHTQADKIWVKSFDGTNWVWAKVTEHEHGLPEQLLLDIMGNRKRVLFVEGTSGSYDTKLYTELYKDYYIVPCGGCSSVITRTKAMKVTEQLHDLECYGIIDRDYRTDHEIDKLKESGIFPIEVAEVENLFLVEELLLVINNILHPGDKSRIEGIKSAIINERYKKQKNSQICEAVVSELRYKLSSIKIQNGNEEQARASLKAAYQKISYDNTNEEVEKRFNIDDNNYKQVLSVFNCKSLSCEAERVLDIKKDYYKEFVIEQLYSSRSEEIKKAISSYLPTEIPI